METGSTERVVMTFEKVRDVLVDLLGVEADEVTHESSVESLGGDSMDAAQFVLDLEEALGLEIYEDQFPNPMRTTVQTFVTYVDQGRTA